jgi:hypothetical protein
MSSLSNKEIKELNSITPIYSNQNDKSPIAADIAAPHTIETKMDSTKNISYDITPLLKKDSGIDYGMKDFPFVFVSYYIEKHSYKPFLLFHVEETKGKYGFPEMNVNKEEIFNNNDMANPEDEKTFLGRLLEQILGTNKENKNENEKDTKQDAESKSDSESESESESDTEPESESESESDAESVSESELDENNDVLANEILKSYTSLTGLPEELSENNYKGFINTNNALYFFFEHHELYNNNNNNHWATIDELLHQKRLYNGAVIELTTELFTQVPEATKLLANKKVIEEPKICYLADYNDDSYSTQYFEEDDKPFSVDSFTNTTSVPFFDDIYLFTSKQIANTNGSQKAKRAVLFMNKAVHVIEDELTTEDADILNNYNMICHEKKDNNYIIIQKDTLFYLLPL